MYIISVNNLFRFARNVKNVRRRTERRPWVDVRLAEVCSEQAEAISWQKRRSDSTLQTTLKMNYPQRKGELKLSFGRSSIVKIELKVDGKYYQTNSR